MIGKQLETRRKFLKFGGGALAGSLWTFGPHSAVAIDLHSHGPDIQPWTSSNPALSGAFEPIFDERDDADLKVEGEIPRSLRGVFMRNGPNPQYEPDDHYAYPFDGTGMVHAIYIENGRARYRNRWVSTKEMQQEREAGHRIFNSSFSAPPHADLANTNIIHHAGRYLKPEFPTNLTTISTPWGCSTMRASRLLSCRHIRSLIHTPANFFPSLTTRKPALSPTCARTSKVSSTRLCRSRARGTPWCMTFLSQRIMWSPLLDRSFFDRSRPGPPATWQPDRGSMIAVIPRNAKSSKDVIWIQSPPFFQFHTMNAFEEGNRIEVTFPWYDSFSLTHPSSKLELHRLTLDLQEKSVVDEALDDQACEFSRVNDAYLGRKARYGYVGLRNPRPGERPQMGAFEAMARYDLSSGKKVVHPFPASSTVCEPLFLADPHGKSEEDGFVFSFVHQQDEPGGSFVILDARHLSGKPLATVHLPRRVPAGLHGSWIPA